jgi:hypothetical protein
VPTLTAIQEPAFGRVRLEVDFSDTPAATYVHVHRGTSAGPVHGASEELRLHGVTADLTDAFGTWTMQRVSNGRAVFYDTELPLDTNIYYRADSSQALTTASATAGPVNIASSGTIWLKDPIRPANDIQITLSSHVSDPLCDPSAGIYFIGFEGSDRAASSGRFSVEDAANPVIASRLRRSITSTFVLVTRQLADRDKVERLLATGDVLFLQTPASWGYGDMYLDVGDANESRLARDHRKPWRQWQLPFVVTDSPPGLQYGVDGARWMDGCDVYATWGDITAAGKTWLDWYQREVG